ncbi:MAG: S8 family serine peptidase, partial [Clostridia bacterium]|nr:S8 family serine peptidase [Clostridia bacterium]
MTKRLKEKMIKALYRGVALFGACGFLAAAGLESLKKGENLSSTVAVAESEIKEIKNANVNLNTEKYFDSSVVSPLPDAVAKDEEISVIVTMNSDSLVEVYKDKDTTLTLTEFVATPEAKRITREAKAEQDEMIALLKKSGIKYSLGERYDIVLNGFEVIIKGGDFSKLQKTVEGNGSLIISETYEPAATEIVTNDVDVYETGIFDSSDLEYKGDGVVVAVLDTGLDYTHSAFDVSRFASSSLAFTQKNVSEKVPGMMAAKFTKGLTGEDVYMNEKIPYAYDYADKDPDVLPISSSHGTHVAGIIAGHDDQITGVAPNAQLAIMKVFSDRETGAKDSWLIAALEDCVVLGVDVINMSLGMSCGFAREVDKVQMNEVYDSIHEAGISMVCAASNDANATTGSEKNGSLGLTSNPDSGTVGSPSTYSATLSVASVDGVKTPYFKYGEEIIYFKEAMNSSAKTMDFVDKILDDYGEEIGRHLDSYDFEYVTIPGIGRESDYPDEDDFYKGKIVLVKRGTSTFEDKVRIALEKKGAAGIIIYNNVSGDITMSIGKTDGAVCSISQDEGEMLAEKGTGILHLNREFLAGPFMSSFSSWGPTSGLEIKPEITAHGGEIYSAIPGGGYERMSGTSMACPNQAGATALIRQYVKSGKFGDNLTNQEINAIVYQLMMSTTDIVYNKNGIPFAVRKQGSGLVNMKKALETQAYIITSNENGVMEKTKLEIGDDKERTGVYEMSFEVRNISSSAISYDLNA